MRRVKAVITVEAAVIVPLFLGIFAIFMILLFYFHDKNVITATAHEALVIQSAQEGVKEEDVENYFAQRIRNKLLLFPSVRTESDVQEEGIEITCSARKKKIRCNITLYMERTEPGNYIRRLKRIGGIGE